MQIKEAKLKDIKDVTKLIKKMAFNLGYMADKDKIYYSNNRIQEIVFDYIIDQDCGLFVCEKEEKIIGVLICYLYQPIVTDRRYKRAQDVLIQPHPDLKKTQKGKVFLKLLRTYEQWAKRKGAKEIFLGVNIRNDITKHLYRNGYQIADVLVKKEV